jgi:maleylpyruvate isomerase
VTAEKGPSEQLLAWLETGTMLFESTVERLSDEELGAPSSLPGWQRAHVIGHIARNADALGNLLEWARTGVETPMYRDATQRATEIEASARQAPGDLRTDVRAADGRLRAGVVDLPVSAWLAEVRTARGRTVTAAQVPWMRIREVWLHAVDMDAGVDIDGMPTGLARLFIDDVVDSSNARSDFPSLRMELADGTASWRTRPADGEPFEVRGEPSQLLGWLTGRSDGSRLTSSGPLPCLPSWL